ncbi:tRNA lysidine(34) synthetase TilS [Mycoplasmoides pirum]|uniref:tRNA lysidine(34) synthetase TilS n=1 Tax=Mycoplasmoides pirum TaxID=2122 RepID=UPI0004893BBB|nr:tRNA lysidine(34) synthetase TilS [Mycoplasmoides pirum]
MERLVIGVSGGPDSMALLNHYKNRDIVVCHVNYNLRPTAIRDENIVVDYCKKNNIKYFVLHVDSKNKTQKNFQNWARIVRYDFMHKIAKEYNASRILIAHNLNDFLETAIMQLEKNKKVLYLGIKKHSKYKDIDIYRPLINVWKKDIYKYCESNNIIYGLDESNNSLKYYRNYIRFILSKWSQNKIDFLLKKIIDFNQKQSNLVNQINSIYKKWKKDMNVDYILKYSPEIISSVIYELFKDNEIKYNLNKFNAVLILMQKNNPNKYFRIGNNKKIVVKNKKLLIVN